jgi:NAD-dependent SIR2 family protein deacetylase
MTDIFENTILCKNCNKQMEKGKVVKNSFSLRALKCPKCHSIIIHPQDEIEYKHFMNLKKKKFAVKLRMVGNSYTVSIPKEIVKFINDQNKVLNELVKLNFEGMRKLSLIFDDEKE